MEIHIILFVNFHNEKTLFQLISTSEICYWVDVFSRAGPLKMVKYFGGPWNKKG